ncbi:hypothetical protein NDU88_006082 [Pleurodeles waltl]|uniref:Uncharacterized protein n=1 Tax=Pleurodeles waltl TaxID=8319 RepID=A0AAV7TCX6_PLEWA|nr:hypothetical protein NDU88_006082 [Pleurodeles waltl]
MGIDDAILGNTIMYPGGSFWNEQKGKPVTSQAQNPDIGPAEKEAGLLGLAAAAEPGGEKTPGIAGKENTDGNPEIDAAGETERSEEAGRITAAVDRLQDVHFHYVPDGMWLAKVRAHLLGPRRGCGLAD